MIVTITSCAPVRALRKPASPAQSAPTVMATSTATTRCRTTGRSSLKPTQPAAAPPSSIWPRPPMLNKPARNAEADAESGHDERGGELQRLGERPDPSFEGVHAGVVDRAPEQGGVGAPDRLPDRLECVGGPGEEVSRGLAHVLVGQRDQQRAEQDGEHQGEHGGQDVAGGDLPRSHPPSRVLLGGTCFGRCLGHATTPSGRSPVIIRPSTSRGVSPGTMPTMRPR